MKQRYLQWVLKYLPKRTISRWMGKLARQPWSRRLIPIYIRYFRVDLTPVKKPVHEFENLLAFFIRELRPDMRPVAREDHLIISPVDGTISQVGEITEGKLFQAKGITYSLEELLGHQKKYVKSFFGGRFMTIYLSPSDYHRFHMPLDGKIHACTHLPGELYPVNPMVVNCMKGIFVINERLISYIDSMDCGKVAMVKVGATNVGSIKVSYDRNIATNLKAKKESFQTYDPAFSFKKGEELGWFEFGSTVILLFEPNQIDWMNHCVPGAKVQMGQAVARIIKNGGEAIEP